MTITLFMISLGLASPPDFTREVLPTLREHCFQCHSHETGKNKGGLVVDSASGLKLGGDGGPALNTQNPNKALCFWPSAGKRAFLPCHQPRHCLNQHASFSSDGFWRGHLGQQNLAFHQNLPKLHEVE